MSRSLFSPSWHSVAGLRPRLAPQARLFRHVYRGQVWHVIQDPVSGKHHRLSQSAHALVNRMDGRATVQAIWEDAVTRGGEDACTQNEMVDLLVQLHNADLLQTDITPDSAALLVRHRKKRFETFRQWLMSPTSLKLKLVDPSPFIDRWAPGLAWVFGPAGALLWLLTVAPALFLAVAHWGELTHNLSDRALSASNLLVLALVFPVVKLLHELGHAFATRVWGGHVHEMGLMFLVFAPFPYVDASASAAFPSKVRRAVVGAAGMLVELFLAAIALYVWLASEPGIARAIAYNTMLIAGISTLVVNGNPLLRYDAYYILADLIEIPNLGQRGQQYLAWWWDRHVYGMHDLTPPQTAPGEKPWLLAYTPLAWCYRMYVTLTIALFLAGQFFFLGVLLAAWGLATQVGVPLWKAWKHVLHAPALQPRRLTVRRRTRALVLGGLALLFLLPAPLRSTTQGVIWLPDRALLHAGGDGFFQRWLAAPGTQVRRGQALYVLEDRALAAQIAVARAQRDEAAARYRAEQFNDPVKAQLTGRQLQQQAETLSRLEARAARLVGVAGSDGLLVAVNPADLPGRFLKEGTLVAYLMDPAQLRVRAVVPQDDIGLVRARLRGVDLRLEDRVMTAQAAQAERETPGGVSELPSPALSLNGGGPIPTDPGDSNGVKTLERIFLLDLRPVGTPLPPAFGERVHVRLDLGYEPVGFQGVRRLRQLFLSQLHV